MGVVFGLQSIWEEIKGSLAWGDLTVIVPGFGRREVSVIDTGLTGSLIVDYKVLDIMAVYNPAIPPPPIPTGGFLGLDLG